jgi:hypothetical protein
MDGATSLLGTQLGAAAVCAYLMQALQKWSKTPWINEHTAGINVAVRAALAVVSTIGIGWAWSNGTAGGHVLTIAIPSTVILLHGLWHVFVQYAIQHGWGNLLSPNPPVAPPKISA